MSTPPILPLGAPIIGFSHPPYESAGSDNLIERAATPSSVSSASSSSGREEVTSDDATRAPSVRRSDEKRKGKEDDVRDRDAPSDEDDVDHDSGADEGEDKEKWSYAQQLKDDERLLSTLDNPLPPSRHLSLSYKHLSVRGVGKVGEVQFSPTVGSILQGPFGKIQDKKRLKGLSAARESEEGGKQVREKEEKQDEKKGKKGQKGEGLGKGERYLLHDFSGVVKSGEMMLVVGRPGSGTTTFLKALAGLTTGFAGVDGEISYGTMATQKDLKPYQNQVIFNSEDDICFPNLSVGDTLSFAIRMNTPAPHARLPKEEGGPPLTPQEYELKSRGELLKVFGLEHTVDTKVGDAYIRGVSGGEKKRVSIAEVVSARASIQCWDNATRGLDANTALAYAKTMRTLTDVSGNATVVSLYQAGNQIYDRFDKVTVIAEGLTIYYGPIKKARQYFEDMGFICVDGANVADFLTGVTVAKERKIKEGMEHEIPESIPEFAERYRSSDIAREMSDELDAHLGDQEALKAETEQTQKYVQMEKHQGALKGQPQRLNFLSQVKIAIVREYQQRWGDQWTLWARQGTTLIQALLVGSLFYALPGNTGGIFTRGGALFLSILYPSLISLAETTAAFSGRAVLAKHKGFSMYRASAIILAQTIADLPIFLIQLAIFCLIIYFMCGLIVEPGHFFIFYLFVFVTTITTTAFFRMIGSLFSTFQGASKVSGLAFSILVTYAGYIIASPSMHPWFAWIRWLDPVYYAFEALMGNEFTGQTFECVPNQLVPYGQGYTAGQNQGCALAGAEPGATSVDGSRYLSTSLELYRSHLWRNFGIIIALWIFFVFITCVGTERLPAAGSTKSVLLYKRGGGNKYIKSQREPKDEEEGAGDSQPVEKSGDRQDKKEDATAIQQSESVFTWQHLTYTVQSGGKSLNLLEDVEGYCKPGSLTALMGSSGAGKSTLLDCLAKRKSEGELSGEVLVNGQPLPVSFQRTTGYCEQQDVHLPTSTVREALEFSALLRQPRSTPDADKLAYVDTIIDLLELHDIEDAIIGTPGAGLGIEQRKRLTIGVELSAKPLLLFLDEPTSGLDGQSSFLIVSFLKKLAAAGQAVLCTIHQPSASLFAEFDSLLLLKAGGKTVYFGKIDELSDYFKDEGVTMPKGINPAERMIDIVSGDLSKGKDWAEVWLKSSKHDEVVKELDRLKRESQGKSNESEEDQYEYAATTGTQMRQVFKRASTQLWRDTDYVTNKVALHIGSALFNGFSFWMIGNRYADLQNRLFTIFQFIFVAPGVIAQVQPKFIANRDIFEAREKKARFYSWQVFVFGEIIAEIPYLLACAFLYWACWYAVVGFSFRADIVGPVYLQMTLYEFLYTGIGQFVAAYAPNAVFAALVNPLLIGVLVSFSGVLVPYASITAFWRYWLYYLNPFNYLMGGMLVFPIWDVEVQCTMEEFARFTAPAGQTCEAYMAPFMQQHPGYLQDPSSTTECMYCIYSKGSEYLATLNLGRHVYGWRDICITFLFCISSYAFVFLLMKLRSKQTKGAKSE